MKFLLKKIGGPTDKLSQEKIDTISIINLGGASVQMVFKITKSELQPLSLGFREIVVFCGRTYHLFQNSILGYGLDVARNSNFNRFKMQAVGFNVPIVETDNNGHCNDCKTYADNRLNVTACHDRIKQFLNQGKSFAIYSNFFSIHSFPFHRNPYESSK